MNDTTVIIFVPGLGRDSWNTGDGVAEVLARAYDRFDDGITYSTKSDAAISAPRGLKVSKTVVQGDSKPVLQVFELDYRSRLEGEGTVAGPPPSPGVVRSTKYAIAAGWMLFWTWRRRPKTWVARLQIGVGLLGASALVLAALVAIYAALVAAGVGLPDWLFGLLDESKAGWTFGLASTGVLVTWASIRKYALALAATLRHLMDYVWNRERTNDSVGLTLEDGIAGLRDTTWEGRIHLVGYSFGSLILYDAVLPKIHSQKASRPMNQVSSIVTIGCPLDFVRLYFKDYATKRTRRCPDAPWINIFNAADLFGSNMKNENDVCAGQADAGALGLESEGDSTTIESIRYLDEKLGFLQVFMMRGFRTHGGYWGEPNDAHCFTEQILEQWLPSTERVTHAALVVTE